MKLTPSFGHHEGTPEHKDEPQNTRMNPRTQGCVEMFTDKVLRQKTDNKTLNVSVCSRKQLPRQTCDQTGEVHRVRSWPTGH